MWDWLKINCRGHVHNQGAVWLIDTFLYNNRGHWQQQKKKNMRNLRSALSQNNFMWQLLWQPAKWIMLILCSPCCCECYGNEIFWHHWIKPLSCVSFQCSPPAGYQGVLLTVRKLLESIISATGWILSQLTRRVLHACCTATRWWQHNDSGSCIPHNTLITTVFESTAPVKWVTHADWCTLCKRQMIVPVICPTDRGTFFLTSV